MNGDLRQGGSWSTGQRVKNDALWLLASAAIAACRVLSPHALRRLGEGLGYAAMALAPGARRTALGNVARVFPGLTGAERSLLVRRCFAELGRHLGETVAMLAHARGARGACEMNSSLTPPLDPEASAVFHDALRVGRGVLFASAHLGPWEGVAASIASQGVPMVVLARESYDPRFTRLLARMREEQGLEVLWRGKPGAAARILRTLRRNRVLGVPMDLRSRVPSCNAPFLGHDAPTAIGPARIALRLRAPVVVGSAAPRGDGSLVVTATAMETEGLAPDDAGARELTRRINAELSRRILALPHAWVWMHERWATDAPGG